MTIVFGQWYIVVQCVFFYTKTDYSLSVYVFLQVVKVRQSFNFQPHQQKEKDICSPPSVNYVSFLVHFFEPMKAYTYTSNCNCIHRNRQQNRFAATPFVCIPFFSSINNLLTKKSPPMVPCDTLSQKILQTEHSHSLSFMFPLSPPTLLTPTTPLNYIITPI